MDVDLDGMAFLRSLHHARAKCPLAHGREKREDVDAHDVPLAQVDSKLRGREEGHTFQ